jgi:uncharacterized protein (DUF1684 family)
LDWGIKDINRFWAAATPHDSRSQSTLHRAFRSSPPRLRISLRFSTAGPGYLLQSLLQKKWYCLFLIFLVNSSFTFSQTADTSRINVTENDGIIRDINLFQKTLNEEFANSETSPLDSTDLERFSAINFYPPNVNFYVGATFKKYKGQKKFKMKTSTDRRPQYIKYGEVTFTLDDGTGTEYKLCIYKNVELSKKPGYEKYLFLPFTDLTNGETTYGGGRYIDLQIPEGDVMIIDFNKAYNPYCAYTHRYSCPIVPDENFLNIKVEAGVKEGFTSQ